MISAAGIRPDSKLAQEAGLATGPCGGIVVDAHMRTSDPAIYAVGDAVETTHLVGGVPVLVPLAGPANKQARIAADNISGLPSGYPGSLGNVHRQGLRHTGGSDGPERKNGEEEQPRLPGRPSPSPEPCQLLSRCDDVEHEDPLRSAGRENPSAPSASARRGVDKRIDVIATAIRAGLMVSDLGQLELSYAPPFSSAKDPVNMAGFLGSNILRGLVKSVTYPEVEAMQDPFILDVRPKAEFDAGSIPRSVNIPREELRDRIQEVPGDRPIVVSCRTGIASYSACRVLKQMGFEQLSNLSGGYITYGHYTAKAGRKDTV